MPRPRASSRCASEVTSPLTPLRSKPGPRSCTLISMRSGNTDKVICEQVSSSRAARSQTDCATRSSSASSSRRLGMRTDMTSGDGLLSGIWRSASWALAERLEHVQGSRDVRGHGGYESKAQAGHRMGELQRRGMQGLARQLVEQGPCEATLRIARAQQLFGPTAVHRVPDHGQLEVGEVDADLVRASGVELELELGHGTEAPHHAPAGARNLP